jgi:uncharacterized membrane protein YeaQ/YmgE (transglycosylase-associated protein family)
MSIVGWMILGTIVGLLARWLLPGRFPGDIAGTVLVGMLGAFLGGGLFSLIADRSVGGFDLLSLVTALIGAALLLSVIRRIGDTGSTVPGDPISDPRSNPITDGYRDPRPR